MIISSISHKDLSKLIIIFSLLSFEDNEQILTIPEWLHDLLLACNFPMDKTQF